MESHQEEGAHKSRATLELRFPEAFLFPPPPGGVVFVLLCC